MCWVYVLRSKKDGRIYIGCTRDLQKRILYHNKGKVRSTRSRRPWDLVFNKRVDSITEARKLENFFKTGQGRKLLKSVLAEG